MKMNVKTELKNISGIPSFDFEEIPVAYFSDNNNGKLLRKQLIKNELKISECNVGELEKTFFSKENINLINKYLILSVYTNTNKQFLICPQKEGDLIIVMRYVFIEYGRNLPFDIAGQIKDLNCTVVGEILPNIITNATQRVDYLDEINNPRKIIPLPVNVHKSNRSFNDIFSSRAGSCHKLLLKFVFCFQ
jgi:hypothetical protein